MFFNLEITQKNQGFTLIELIVSMAVTLLIASGTYAAFIQFNRQQRVNASYEDVRNSLTEARSNTLSQVIDKCNTSQTLIGHRIQFSGSTYTLMEECTGSLPIPVKIKNIPSDVILTATPSTFRFLVGTGESPTPGSISLSSGNIIRTITVNDNGTIE